MASPGAEQGVTEAEVAFSRYDMALDSQGVLTLKNASFRIRQMALHHLLAVCSWGSCLTSLNICSSIHELGSIIIVLKRIIMKIKRTDPREAASVSY